jgi:hypothetical protein
VLDAILSMADRQDLLFARKMGDVKVLAALIDEPPAEGLDA